MPSSTLDSEGARAQARAASEAQAQGAIRIGKTNTPEFGAGSLTFNPVFGATRNPYDLSETVGRAAAALLSIPAGSTQTGLPAGLQVVGRHNDDWGVLQLGHAFERETAFWRRHPAPSLAGA